MSEDLVSFGKRLETRLSSSDPLPKPTARMSLAYGRHRGPVPPGTRVAAVVIALYQDRPGHWIVPLTLRPQTLNHHGGQVSLPGGRIEPGEDAEAASLREFHEEMGIEAVVRHRCGQLSTQYVFASANLVHPVVTIIEPPDRPWVPDPVEVAEVIEMPLDLLHNASARICTVRQVDLVGTAGVVGSIKMQAPAIQFDGHQIWGATALILDQLAQILHECD